MARDDLLSLSIDDLASLTNRGTVKRAEKELATGQLTFEVSECEHGHLSVTWSDGIVCQFLASGSIHEAQCSSGALGITRHIVRSVLAYQVFQRGCAQLQSEDADHSCDAPVDLESESSHAVLDQSKKKSEPGASSLAVQEEYLVSWDPGEITDDQLVDCYGKAAIQRARTRFESGTLVELTRGNKPLAIFLDENCFVRFMVRGDLRYATADCSETALSRFVAMAVWAFRRLPKDQEAGLLSLQLSQPDVPESLMQKLQDLLSEVTLDGIARSPKAILARLTRLEEAMRKDSLVWPAELLSELVNEIELYSQHDARFEPQRLVLLAGELIARARAIRNNASMVPQLLIRGSRFDRPIDIASSRYIGIGMSVRRGRLQTTFNAFFQDADTGLLATIERRFSDQSEMSLQELAQTTIYRGTTLAGLAGSQILLKSGKRLANGELVLPRSVSSFASNPQNFQWEQLKSPLAVEDFGQLASRWAFLPPSYLRPRRRTEGIHVVAISGVRNPNFNPIQQRIEADLLDHSGKIAKLVLPYHAQGANAFNCFLDALQNRGDSARYISGMVSMANQQLAIQPLAVVIEAGERRRALYPYWSADPEENQPKSQAPRCEGSIDETIAESLEPANALNSFFDRLSHFSGEIMLLGLEQGAGPIERLAEELIEVATSMGFLRIAALIQELHRELERHRNDVRHEIKRAVQISHQLLLISRIEAM